MVLHLARAIHSPTRRSCARMRNSDTDWLKKSSLLSKHPSRHMLHQVWCNFQRIFIGPTLSFSQIDKALSGGINVEWCSQEEHKSMRESESKNRSISLMANLSGIASDLIVGMLDSGVGGRSEEQDMKPRKRKGMKL